MLSNKLPWYGLGAQLLMAGPRQDDVPKDSTLEVMKAGCDCKLLFVQEILCVCIPEVSATHAAAGQHMPMQIPAFCSCSLMCCWHGAFDADSQGRMCLQVGCLRRPSTWPPCCWSPSVASPRLCAMQTSLTTPSGYVPSAAALHVPCAGLLGNTALSSWLAWLT